MRNDVIIYGIGPFAALMAGYFEEEGAGRVAGYTVDRPFLTVQSYLGLPVVEFESAESVWAPAKFDMFVAVGYKRMRNRQIMYEKAKKKGYALRNFISQRAILSHGVELGDNNTVMPGVHLEPNVKIGNNNIIWCDTLVGHEARVGNHNYVSGKCVIAGGCTMGDLCFSGNGVITIDSLILRDESHLIAGAVVMRDTDCGTKYIGNPAMAVGRHLDKGIVIERDL